MAGRGENERTPSSNLTEDEVSELRQAFQLFDTDNSGFIDPTELKEALTSLGFDAKNASVFQMIADIDREGKRKVDFNDFLAMMTMKLGDRDTRKDINQVFKLFDTEGKGGISLADLKRVAKELGEGMTDAELMEMVQRADTDNDGLVSADDFYAVLTRRQYS